MKLHVAIPAGTVMNEFLSADTIKLLEENFTVSTLNGCTNAPLS